MSIRKHLLTRKEAATFLGVHTQTLAKWASTGMYQLPFLKIGGRALYRQSDLDSWIESRRRTQVVNESQN